MGCFDRIAGRRPNRLPVDERRKGSSGRRSEGGAGYVMLAHAVAVLLHFEMRFQAINMRVVGEPE
jgi:hypothetical protein